MKNSIALLLAAIVLFHCSPPKQKQVIIAPKQTAATDTSQFFITVSKKLDSLLNNKDSLAAYIRMNDVLFDSAKNIKNAAAMNIFLENIIRYENTLVNDTALRKILAKAYSRWAYYHDDDIQKYNDSVLILFERYLMLTKDQAT